MVLIDEERYHRPELRGSNVRLQHPLAEGFVHVPSVGIQRQNRRRRVGGCGSIVSTQRFDPFGEQHARIGSAPAKRILGQTETRNDLGPAGQSGGQRCLRFFDRGL